MARRAKKAPMKAARVAVIKAGRSGSSKPPVHGAEAARLKQGHVDGNQGNGKG